MKELAQYYRVLGLKATATPAEVKQAYRSLAKKWHPDRFIRQPQLLIQAQQEIQKINQAYEVLKHHSPKVRVVDNVNHPSVVKSNKTASEIHYQRGVEFAEKEQYQEAIAEFTQAIKIDCNYLKAYQYRGFILSKLGYELRADADFKQVANLKLKQKYPTTENINYSNYYNQNKEEYNKYWHCSHTLFAHKKAVSAIHLSQDNTFFVSSSHDGNIKLWQTATKQAILTLRDNVVPINSLALSNNDKILITGNKNTKIYFWNLESKKILKTLGSRFSGHSKEIVAIALDSQTNTLISSSADNLIKVWDLNRGREIKEINCKSENLTCLALNEERSYFCSGSLQRQLRIRNITTGKVIRSLRGESGVFTLAFSPNGKFLAAGQINCQIVIWNIETGRKHCILKGHQDRISSLFFSEDNKTLISGSWDKNIKLWNIETATPIDTLQGHTNTVSCLAITADNSTIISGSYDCRIKIWQLQ